MRLSELEQYQNIIIQSHDNPDADTIASGYGLYVYFLSKGKNVRLIYSGRLQIKKPNLKLMVDKLQIPITYEEELIVPEDALLITVDCQYGAGNVKKFEAMHVAVIDHHQIEIVGMPVSIINSNMGSCATLVWSLLKKEGFPVNEYANLGTALYYGLYSDTNQLSEIYHPVDMDMRDDVICDMAKIKLFRNSNLSLQELEVAGIALIRYIFNDDYGYAIIKAQPCDPNILGLISDFLIQVDGIFTCVVYNQLQDGYKLSVRSCTKEVKASELAEYLTLGIGSGGGHFEKAGGFISLNLYEGKYPTLHTEAYFGERMNAYFEEFDLIDAETYQIDKTNMKRYRKKRIKLGFVRITDIFRHGTRITVRTLAGDASYFVTEGLYLLIGLHGEVHSMQRSDFEKTYEEVDENFQLKTDYPPMVKDQSKTLSLDLLLYAKACMQTAEDFIYARPLTKSAKVFTKSDKDNYILGRSGDYIAVKETDEHDIYAVECHAFMQNYEERAYR